MTVTADQIDKDLLLKDLVPEPNRKGVWNFYNPKNLYLTDLQGELYLKLMGDSRYSSKFHDTTEMLIGKNAERIADHLKSDSVFIIDLGPGYPSKTFPIVDALLKRKKEVTYWAVDVNEHFGNIARDAIAERGVKNSFAKKILFEDTAQAVKKGDLKCPKLVIIGLTFMNFKADAILKIISDCLDGKNDICLSAIECSDNVDINRLTDGYRTEEAKAFLFVLLSILGCKEEDVKYDVSFNDGRVEMAFVMKHAPQIIKGHGVRDGDRIIMAISYRHTVEFYKKILNSKFSENYFDMSGNTVLALSGL